MHDHHDPHRYVDEDAEAGVFRVHRDALASDEAYRLELSEIFDHTWLYVAHESEVAEPGRYVAREIAGRPVVISRAADGELRAFINSCPHRGAEVCREEKGQARAFRCFYHAWTFDLDGSLIGIPGQDAYAEGVDVESLGLTPVPRFDSYRGFLFVSFDPAIVSLVDYLGNAAEYIDLVTEQSSVGMEIVEGTHLYSIDANWKLLVENSIDGYHLVPLHTTYFAHVKATEGERTTPAVPTAAYDLGNGHAVIVDHGPWGRPTARWVPSFGEETKPMIDARRAELVERFGADRAERIVDEDINVFIFPNLVINDVMGVVVRTIWPTGPARLEVSAWALAPRDDDPSLRSITMRSFVSFLGPGGFATPDDMEALESCQRGFRAAKELAWSDLSRGMHKTEGHLSSDEHHLRAFWREWQRRVGGAERGASSNGVDAPERGASSNGVDAPEVAVELAGRRG